MENKSVGSVILHLLLSILLVFTLLMTLFSAFGDTMTISKTFIFRLEKENASALAYTEWSNDLAEAYNTTAIPAEIYTDNFSESDMEQAMQNCIQDYWNQGSYTPDFSAVEAAITTYFEEQAVELNYDTTEESYQDALESALKEADSNLLSYVDVYHFQTMQKSNLISKFQKLHTLCFVAMLCGIVLSVILAFVLLLLRDRYWIGVSLFSAGVIAFLPCLILLATGFVNRFALKTTPTFQCCTGLMKECLWIGIIAGGVAIVLGILGMITTKKNTKAEN